MTQSDIERRNIIGFDFGDTSGRKIHSVNPATQVRDASGFVVATSEEVDKAVTKATLAWKQLRKINADDRAAFMDSIADHIEQLGDFLIETIHLETAYPPARILTERNRTCAQLRMFAEALRQHTIIDTTRTEALPDRMPSPRPALWKTHISIGPVAVFGASNFPLAYSTAGGDAASAFAAGCPVIVKAHDSHLMTNALIATQIVQAAQKTGMPDGIFSSLNGDGYATGEQLVSHDGVAGVGFTGSISGGRALLDIAAKRKRPIPVFAEMGSVNPVFIFPGAISTKPELARQLVSSMTMTGGQFCTKPGLWFVVRSDETIAWLSQVEQEVSKVEGFTLLNQSILDQFQRSVTRIQSSGVVEMMQKESGALPLKPVLMKVDVENFMHNPELHHEIFGPYALIILCHDVEDYIRATDQLEGQLTASLFFETYESVSVSRLSETLMDKAGRIIFNGVPTGVEVVDAMTHGGPYPASTDSRFTAVGIHAVRRWLRPVTFQGDLEHFPLPNNG